MKEILENLKKDSAVDNLIEWLGNSELKNSAGEPFILYCGTLSDFTVFDIDKTINDNFFGKGFYFSDSIEDVNHNYAHDKGPDNVSKIENIQSRMQDELSKHINQEYYIDIIQNEKESIVGPELYQVIKDLFECFENEEEDYILSNVDNVDIFIEYETNRIKQKDNDGFIIPVYLKAEKVMDIANHVFTREENIISKKLDFIINKIEEYNTSGEYLKTELMSLFSEVNTEYSLSFDEFETALFNSISHEVDDDEYEEILNFASNIFNDEEICIEHVLKGELQEFIDTMTDCIRVYSGINDSHKFISIFQEEFPEESVSVLSILENPKIAFEFVDNYIPDQNYGFGQCYVHFKGLCSIVFQSMGYDCIKIDANHYFNTMNGTKNENGENTNHYIVFKPNQIKSAIGNNGEYSIYDNDIRYRINLKSKEKYNSITKKECEQIINELKINYPKSPEIILIDDISKISLHTKKIPDNTAGFYEKSINKVFILTQNVKSREDFTSTLIHEVFGHMSLKNILNKNYDITMNKVYDYFNNKGELTIEKELYTNLYNLDMNKSSDRAILAEEKMASFIENNGFEKFPLKNIIIGAIQNSLRIYIPSLKFNKNDVIYLANKTHKNLKEKKKNNIKLNI